MPEKVTLTRRVQESVAIQNNTSIEINGKSIAMMPGDTLDLNVSADCVTLDCTPENNYIVHWLRSLGFKTEMEDELDAY